MAVWLVRAGSRGETETFALEHGVAAIGWDELPDVSGIASREQLADLMRQTYPDAKPQRIQNSVAQVWAFARTIAVGDLVTLPLKRRSAVAFGEVTGGYAYRSENPAGARHVRPVRWHPEIPRSRIGQDLLYSLGAFLTVCRIERNDAERRLRALLEGKPADEPPQSEWQAPADLNRYSQDQIRDSIGRRWKGHELATLVEQLLVAQAYTTRRPPEGPDGGVDILAGQGALGFDRPRLAVQVKSSDTPVDVKDVREFQTATKNFGADFGLFVSWGGFRRSVEKEVLRHFFDIRLWDADDLVEEILDHYDRLPEDVQAELPLKRIWVLAGESES